MKAAEQHHETKVAGRLATVSDVVALTDAPGIHRLIEVYGELRGGNASALPRRKELKPECLAPFLPDTASIGFNDAGEPYFRLVGERIRMNFQKSPVGQPYRTFVAPERADSAVASFVACRTHRCGMFVSLRKIDRRGRIFDVEVLCLPFAGDGDRETVDSILLVDFERNATDWSDASVDHSIAQVVNRRYFVDLGFGVPTDHTDIVAA